MSFGMVQAHALLRGPVRDFWPLCGRPTPPRVGSGTATRGLWHVGLIRHGTGGAYATDSRQDPHAISGGLLAQACERGLLPLWS